LSAQVSASSLGRRIHHEQAFCYTSGAWLHALLGKRWIRLGSKAGRRGARGGRGGPRGLGRQERSETGIVSFCKCENFAAHDSETLKRENWRQGKCRVCGGNKREWRCPVHKLLATPLETEGMSISEGCPRCGRAPKQQRWDAYLTKQAREG
jgi:hypothetical protein